MSLAVVSPYGHPAVNSAGVRVPHSSPTLAALVALPATDPACTHGNVVLVDDGSEWVYNSASVLTADNIVIAGTHTTGRWLRKVGAVDLGLPIAFGLADGATIWTVPTGCIFKLESAHWHIT